MKNTRSDIVIFLGGWEYSEVCYGWVCSRSSTWQVALVQKLLTISTESLQQTLNKTSTWPLRRVRSKGSQQDLHNLKG